MGCRNRPLKEIIKARKIWTIYMIKNKTNMMHGKNVEENVKNRHNNNMLL